MDTLLHVHDMHDRRGRHAVHSHTSHKTSQRDPFGRHTLTALQTRCIPAQCPAPRVHCHQLHSRAAQGRTAETYHRQHVDHNVPANGWMIRRCHAQILSVASLSRAKRAPGRAATNFAVCQPGRWRTARKRRNAQRANGLEDLDGS